MLALAPVVLLGLALFVTQPPNNTIIERLQDIDRASIQPGDCDAQLSRANALNGPDLFYAAVVCGAARKPIEASFLLAAGQTRSMADMSGGMPAAKADADSIVDLYGFIYSVAGGPGDDRVLRETASRARLFRLLDEWSPSYGPDYNPGWQTRSRLNAEEYRTSIDELKARRRAQLDEIGRLYSDDAYFALHQEFQELQQQNGAMYVEGTPEAARSTELLRRMDERAITLGVRRAAPTAEPAERRFPPSSPAADEAIVAERDDPIVTRCSNAAEWHAIARESQVERVLVTRSEEWGIIWRADVRSAEGSMERSVCTAHTTSSLPFEASDPPLEPLPSN